MRVEDLEDLFTAAETLTCLKPVAGSELLIVTNGGGAGVLAVDDLDIAADPEDLSLRKVSLKLPLTTARIESLST